VEPIVHAFMLIKDKTDAGRVHAVRTLERGGCMHLVFSTLENNAPVGQCDGHPTHLRILEAILIVRRGLGNFRDDFGFWGCNETGWGRSWRITHHGRGTKRGGSELDRSSPRGGRSLLSLVGVVWVVRGVLRHGWVMRGWDSHGEIRGGVGMMRAICCGMSRGSSVVGRVC
jgi:hypothetical protein